MPSMLDPINHISVDDQGQAWIDGTSIKVVDIVFDHLAHGWSPEEIRDHHYRVPTLAQVYAALAYYYDHQVELYAQIRQQIKDIQELLA